MPINIFICFILENLLEAHHALEKAEETSNLTSEDEKEQKKTGQGGKISGWFLKMKNYL